MYASMFTLALFLMFSYLFVGIIYLCFDRDSAYFIGRWPLISLIWVLIFGVAHAYHVKNKRPSRQLMMGMVFPAAVTFFLVFWLIMHTSERITHLLNSAECTRAAELRELHRAALDARAFHAQCLNATGEHRLIHYCPGYEEALNEGSHERNWNYLRSMEYAYGCAGFCNPDQEIAMWTYQGFQDTCANSVANVMKSKVSSTSFRLMMYSVVVIFGFLAWIELLIPSIKATERGESLPPSPWFDPIVPPPGSMEDLGPPPMAPLPPLGAGPPSGPPPPVGRMPPSLSAAAPATITSLPPGALGVVAAPPPAPSSTMRPGP